MPRNRVLSTCRICLVAAFSLLALGSGCREQAKVEIATDEPRRTPDISGRVHEYCGACHAYPPPETFPKDAWKKEVERGFSFGVQAGMLAKAPPLQPVIRYYEDRAPESLPQVEFKNQTDAPPVAFERLELPPIEGVAAPAISNIQLVHLSSPDHLDLLVSEMRAGLVLQIDPTAEQPTWKVLMKAADIAPSPFNPAHLELVDIDGDGIQDILVSNLGNFTPIDDPVGSVILLRGHADGHYTPHTLLSGVGRVADIRAADFYGTGQKDLIVAVFGWHQLGEIVLLRNETTDWNAPKFAPVKIDARHGAIHVPVTDLNGDAKPDFVALLSQEHERVVAFLNQGNGKFEPRDIYIAEHPGIGSSGIELTDFDGDQDLDVIYTNGDGLDEPHLLKPYHGVQWLENRGEYPFTYHPITTMYGVHRALSADFAKQGRNDLIAVSFLPAVFFPDRERQKLDAILYLRQTSSGEFDRFVLTDSQCDHVTAAVGDIWGRGQTDFVTGNFTMDPVPSPVTIWKNRTSP